MPWTAIVIIQPW